MLLKNCLKFSTYNEKVTPRKIPNIVADVPINIPTRKKILTIDLQGVFSIRFRVRVRVCSCFEPFVSSHGSTVHQKFWSQMGRVC